MRRRFWVWLCRFAYRHAVAPLNIPPDGIPGIRDHRSRCHAYEPGPRAGFECYGDGHYLCRECSHFVPEEDEQLQDIRNL
jgi:hypothetical protein